MPKQTNRALASLTLNGSHRRARLWKIVYALGTHRFTDHDVALEIPNDGVYVPGGGVGASAAQSDADLGANNTQLRGLITADAVTSDDVIAGHYDDATVTEYVVDHRYPWAGMFKTREYKIGRLRWNATAGWWDAEIHDLLSQLNRQVGARTSKRCDYVLYDPVTCRVTKASFTTTLTVTGVTDRGIFEATPAAFDQADFFEDGEITWTSGDNDATTQGVMTYDSDTKTWTLHEDALNTIQVGDTATASAGCNHISGVLRDGTDDPTGHCKHKFDNLANFGGYPYLVTETELYDYADSRAHEDED